MTVIFNMSNQLTMLNILMYRYKEHHLTLDRLLDFVADDDILLEVWATTASPTWMVREEVMFGSGWHSATALQMSCFHHVLCKTFSSKIHISCFKSRCIRCMSYMPSCRQLSWHQQQCFHEYAWGHDQIDKKVKHMTSFQCWYCPCSWSAEKLL